MKAPTESLIKYLKHLSSDALVIHFLGKPATHIIAEAANRMNELETQRDELMKTLEATLPFLHTGDELPMSYYKDKPCVLGMVLREIAKAKGEA